jgi:hypothetical protein
MVARAFTMKLALKPAVWISICYDTVTVMTIRSETTEISIAHVISCPVRWHKAGVGYQTASKSVHKCLGYSVS